MPEPRASASAAGGRTTRGGVAALTPMSERTPGTRAEVLPYKCAAAP